jgi:hypothetical protein
MRQVIIHTIHNRVRMMPSHESTISEQGYLQPGNDKGEPPTCFCCTANGFPRKLG